VETHVLDERNEACVVHIIEEPTDVEQKDADLEAVGMRSVTVLTGRSLTQRL
jgi:hypothetical protein